PRRLRYSRPIPNPACGRRYRPPAAILSAVARSPRSPSPWRSRHPCPGASNRPRRRGFPDLLSCCPLLSGGALGPYCVAAKRVGQVLHAVEIMDRAEIVNVADHRLGALALRPIGLV